MTSNMPARLTASTLLLLGDTPVRDGENQDREGSGRSQSEHDSGATGRE